MFLIFCIKKKKKKSKVKKKNRSSKSSKFVSTMQWGGSIN